MPRRMRRPRRSNPADIGSLLLYAGIGYLAYTLLVKPKPAAAVAAPGVPPASEMRYYFQAPATRETAVTAPTPTGFAPAFTFDGMI